MLTENKVKEELSLAYILAAAASKSFITEITRVDVDSVDATIKGNGYLVADSTLYSPELKIQLKATSHAEVKGTNIHFPLPLKNYNDLRLKSGTPRLLVVLCLPEDRTNWLQHSADNLIIQKCAYYLNLADYAETANETSVTVYIPTSNVFSPDTLYEIMEKVSKEEKI